jgi:hypothetical protein
MNKLVILLLCLCFALTVMISSCSNSLNQPGLPGFRCAFGNQEFIADSAVYYSKGVAGVIGTNIYAYSGGKIKFAFYLNPPDTVGTFALDSNRNQSIAYYNPTSNYNIVPTDCYRSSSGSLVITQYYNDSLKLINGYFSFNGTQPGSSGNSLYFSYGNFNNIPRRY